MRKQTSVDKMLAKEERKMSESQIKGMSFEDQLKTAGQLLKPLNKEQLRQTIKLLAQQAKAEEAAESDGSLTVPASPGQTRDPARSSKATIFQLTQQISHALKARDKQRKKKAKYGVDSSDSGVDYSDYSSSNDDDASD